MTRAHLLTQLDLISDNRVTGLGIEIATDNPGSVFETAPKRMPIATGSKSIADRKKMFESFGDAPTFNIKGHSNRTVTLKETTKTSRKMSSVSDRDELFDKSNAFQSRNIGTTKEIRKETEEFKDETMTSTPKKKNTKKGTEKGHVNHTTNRDMHIQTVDAHIAAKRSKVLSESTHNEISPNQLSTGRTKKVSNEIQNSILSLIDSFSDPQEPMSQFITNKHEIQLSPYGFLYSDLLDNDDDTMASNNSLSDNDDNSGYTTNTSIFTLSPKRQHARRDMTAELRLGGLRLENMFNMVLCIEACVEAENDMILLELEGFALELQGSVAYNTTVVDLHI